MRSMFLCLCGKPSAESCLRVVVRSAHSEVSHMVDMTQNAASAPSLGSARTGNAESTGPAPSLNDAIVFLARFFGVAVHMEPLLDGVASMPNSENETIGLDALSSLLRHAQLTATSLDSAQDRRLTELPALMLGKGGRCMVVLSMRDGEFECHVPGIAGTSWMTGAQLALEVPQARWVAMLALVDRLVVMDRGRIVAQGPRDEVLKALAARPAESEKTPAANASVTGLAVRA